MSILLGVQIKKAVELGKIIIDPYKEENISVNSIDVTLYDKLLTYQEFDIVETPEGKRIFARGSSPVLDMKKKNKTYEIIIPEDGLILDPSLLYLGATVEIAGTANYVPMYDGRSSMARLGVQSHLSAGFGDLGFKRTWTLEICVKHPVKFYKGIRIGQVFFHTVDEEAKKEQKIYKGKYSEQTGPQESKSFQDFK